MIKTCQQCGAVNGDPAEFCSSCDAPLGRSAGGAAARRASTPTKGNLALEPEWRREVSSRLQDYRVRRHGATPVDLQASLPFDHSGVSRLEAAEVESRGASAAAPARAKIPRKQRTERYEISIPIHEHPVASSPIDRLASERPDGRSAEVAVFPVASLAQRQRAGLLDAAVLLFSYGGMLALFMVLGGHIGWNKLDAIVTGATLVLFYAQYFALFTIFGGSTPGMMLCHLRVVGFDGNVPTSRQMAWRSFGYLVSAGTCFLGFFWALWDEDRLTWHDRISQTYPTPAERFATVVPRSDGTQGYGSSR